MRGLCGGVSILPVYVLTKKTNGERLTQRYLQFLIYLHHHKPFLYLLYESITIFFGTSDNFNSVNENTLRHSAVAS